MQWTLSSLRHDNQELRFLSCLRKAKESIGITDLAQKVLDHLLNIERRVGGGGENRKKKQQHER